MTSHQRDDGERTSTPQTPDREEGRASSLSHPDPLSKYFRKLRKCFKNMASDNKKLNKRIRCLQRRNAKLTSKLATLNALHMAGANSAVSSASQKCKRCDQTLLKVEHDNHDCHCCIYHSGKFYAGMLSCFVSLYGFGNNFLTLFSFVICFS